MSPQHMKRRFPQGRQSPCTSSLQSTLDRDGAAWIPVGLPPQVQARRHREAQGIAPLKGYDAAFALRGWPDATKTGAPSELAGHDPAPLKGKVWLFMNIGRHGYVELAAWNFELNDWVKMEAFAASLSAS